jgi:hypothetical protein
MSLYGVFVFVFVFLNEEYLLSLRVWQGQQWMRWGRGEVTILQPEHPER